MNDRILEAAYDSCGHSDLCEGSIGLACDLPEICRYFDDWNTTEDDNGDEDMTDTQQELQIQTPQAEGQKRKRGRPRKDDPFRDEKFTPPMLLSALHGEDNYTLDVCGSPLAPAARIIPRFITKEMDGLKYSWANERVWANVPFSNIEPWIIKAWQEPQAFIRMLVPSWTDRQWWQKYVEPYRDRPGSRLTTKFLPRQLFGDPLVPIREKGQPDFWPVLLRFDRVTS